MRSNYKQSRRDGMIIKLVETHSMKPGRSDILSSSFFCHPFVVLGALVPASSRILSHPWGWPGKGMMPAVGVVTNRDTNVVGDNTDRRQRSNYKQSRRDGM